MGNQELKLDAIKVELNLGDHRGEETIKITYEGKYIDEITWDMNINTIIQLVCDYLYRRRKISEKPCCATQ